MCEWLAFGGWSRHFLFRWWNGGNLAKYERNSDIIIAFLMIVHLQEKFATGVTSLTMNSLLIISICQSIFTFSHWQLTCCSLLPYALYFRLFQSCTLYDDNFYVTMSFSLCERLAEKSWTDIRMSAYMSIRIINSLTYIDNIAYFMMTEKAEV
jgi:hypothetical protein